MLHSCDVPTCVHADADPLISHVREGTARDGSAVDNQALFAADGTALESLNVFSYARTGSIAPRQVVSVETVSVAAAEGESWSLPATVAITYNDGSVEEEQVTWSLPAESWEVPGAYQVTGTSASGHAVLAEVTILPFNGLANPSFEATDTSMWTTTGTGLSVRSTDDPRTGSRSAHFYSASASSFTLDQQVTGLPAGRYRAGGAVQGDGEGLDGTLTLSVSTSGGASATAPFSLDGWRNWSTPTTDVVDVVEGETVTVTVTGSLPAAAWGSIDDLALTRMAVPPVDTTALGAGVADAVARDPARYTPESVEALDAAIGSARRVLATEGATQAQVDDARSGLSRPVAGLVEADGAKRTPARGGLSHDNGWDTGLLDGAYTVRMNLFWGENATSFRLYENGQLVSTTPLTYGGVGRQDAAVAVSGKANGTYVYTGELVNSKGATAVAPVTVTVRDALPGTPVLSHDNWDGDGSFVLGAAMWWGTNATSYRFFEGEMLIAEGELEARTPVAQSAALRVDGATVGSHTYRVEFVNAAGTTSSNAQRVDVRR